MQFAKHAAMSLFAAVALWGLISPAAALEPEEVAVLYAQGDQESKELALQTSTLFDLMGKLRF